MSKVFVCDRCKRTWRESTQRNILRCKSQKCKGRAYTKVDLTNEEAAELNQKWRRGRRVS